MTVSEDDLKTQLADLDWGTPAPSAPTPPPEVEVSVEVPADAPDQDNALDALDVSVAGVPPRKLRKRPTRVPRITRGPNAQALLDAATDGQTVAANAPIATARSRRSRTTAPDVLTAAGEGPAVIALFDSMWKNTGSKLARGIGRPKASRQDAALGWYMLLLAMRERDAAAK